MTPASVLRRPAVMTAAALLGVAAAPTAAHVTPDPKALADFVALSDVDPTIIQEMRYSTAHDFVGERIDGYQKPMCILTEPAAKALHQAQRGLLRKGYSLKVYDCYRPQRAVDHFVRWAKDLDDQKMKAEFYPRVDKTRLFADGYIAEKSDHSRGSTVDLTVVRLLARPTRPYWPGERLRACYGPKEERFPDNSVDMGTGFDCFDTLAHTDDPRIQGGSGPTGICCGTCSGGRGSSTCLRSGGTTPTSPSSSRTPTSTSPSPGGRSRAGEAEGVAGTTPVCPGHALTDETDAAEAAMVLSRPRRDP